MKLIKRKSKLNTTELTTKVELDSLKTIVFELKTKVEAELNAIRAQLGSIFRVLNDIQSDSKARSSSSISSQSQSNPNLGYSVSPSNRIFQSKTQNILPQNYLHYQSVTKSQPSTFGFPGMVPPWFQTHTQQQRYGGYNFGSRYFQQPQKNENVKRVSTSLNSTSHSEESIILETRPRKRKKTTEFSETTSISDTTT